MGHYWDFNRYSTGSNELQGSIVSIPNMEHRPEEYAFCIVNATVEENASTSKHALRLPCERLRSNGVGWTDDSTGSNINHSPLGNLSGTLHNG